MASLTTTFIDAQRNRNTSIYQNPSSRPVQGTVRVARFSYPLSASLAAADTIDLGFLNLGAVKIIPESSRVINPTADADYSAILTLQKVDAAGNATEVAHTGTPATPAATTANAVTSFVRPSSLLVPDVAVTDYLRILVGTVTTAASTGTLLFEIAYTSEEAP